MKVDKPRRFDINSDLAYDPNSMPDVYLSSKQVQLAASQVICLDMKNQEALQLVIAAEELQRKKCEGTIQTNEKNQKMRALHEAYRKKYGSWAFASQACKDFYSFFGVKEE